MSPDGPLPGRRVTFMNPEAETSSERDTENYSTEPSVSNVETWLEWQANQLGTPAWWTELQAIPGIRHPQKLAWKIRTSFYIPEVRMRTLLEPGYTVPPLQGVLIEMPALPTRQPLLSRCVAKTSPPDDCLCQESPVLGRETKSTKKLEPPSIGGKCH